MKIYLIRHGQTTSDVEDRYGGDYDDHLTPLGVKQANELSEKLKGSGIEMIFASPKIRAQETANILINTLQVPIKTVADLRERNRNGILTGMVRGEAKSQYPDLVENVNIEENTIEGAEDWEEFRNRVATAFKKIAKSNHKIIGIVSHGGPIKRIYEDLLGVKGQVKIADCGFAELETTDSGLKLLKEDGIIYE